MKRKNIKKQEKIYILIEGVNDSYPKYKVIYHLKEFEIKCKPSLYGIGDGFIRQVPDTFECECKVDKIEAIIKKKWWQFWRRI